MNDEREERDEREESIVRARKGIYLLPNLLTTATLFAAFYAIVAAMRWQFTPAAIAIFVAMIADSLDGRVARLTNTVSAFGAEYDSLADIIAFGLAPALIVYNWGLHFLGKAGWLIAFCYAVAAGLRLARFNLQANFDKRYFYGLPCPSAAGVIAGMIWMQSAYQLSGFFLSTIAGFLTILLAVLMVSQVRYRSFKDSDFKNKVSFSVLLLVVLLFVAIAIDPPKVLFGIFFAYTLSGPIALLKNVRKKWGKYFKKKVK